MQVINVVIPPQKYDDNKYFKHGEKTCYLEDALKEMGYDAIVRSYGTTFIGSKTFEPVDPFNHKVVEECFERGEEVKVLLQERENYEKEY